MRIKKITKTEEYTPVLFGELQDCWETSSVYTPDGWSKVRNFSYIKTGPSKIVRHADHELVCDPGHVLKAVRDGGYIAVRADQLHNSDCICSYNGRTVDFTVEDGPEEDFYDITIDDPHWWYTSGFVSHNSIVLCNTAISSWKGNGPGGRIGQDVLLVTFELDYIKTGLRCLGVVNENIPMNALLDHKDLITSRLDQMKTTYDGRIFISELPPEECSVDHLYHIIDNMKRMHGWKPDVVILDYLDLMVSRNKEYNKDDYTRQKYVANEIRGFAKNENVLVFTATQTNRSASGGGESQVATLNSVAESYAKQFSMDYIITINQSDMERQSIPPRFRFFIAKNRNGPKHALITCEVNYDTMKVKEINT